MIIIVELVHNSRLLILRRMYTRHLRDLWIRRSLYDGKEKYFTPSQGLSAQVKIYDHDLLIALVIVNRHIQLPASCAILWSRSASLSTATGVYFTPSDVRARRSVVMLFVLKMFVWQPRHVIRTPDRFSSRRLELQLAKSCLAQRWIFWRRWSLSLSATWCFGVCRCLSISFKLSGFVWLCIYVFTYATL